MGTKSMLHPCGLGHARKRSLRQLEIKEEQGAFMGTLAKLSEIPVAAQQASTKTSGTPVILDSAALAAAVEPYQGIVP